MITIRVQGRDLSEADLEGIRQLRGDHPEWSRFKLSIELARRWQWRNGVGRLKDMAARALLLKLHARGLIELPAPLHRTGRRRTQAPPSASALGLALRAPPIQGTLESLGPVGLELVDTLGKRRQVSQWLEQYHYRGYSGAVGENVQYVARDAWRRELAVMVFGAAAWKVAARDRFIGWSAPQRMAALGLIANQQRFLILPWVGVPHLASHLLALALRRLSKDWRLRYGHPVWMVETFVDQEQFEGTAYRAAGWIQVGRTTGRTRQDRHGTLQTPLKTVWVRSLHPRFQELLCNI